MAIIVAKMKEGQEKGMARSMAKEGGRKKAAAKIMAWHEKVPVSSLPGERALSPSILLSTLPLIGLNAFTRARCGTHTHYYCRTLPRTTYPHALLPALYTRTAYMNILGFSSLWFGLGQTLPFASHYCQLVVLFGSLPLSPG